MIYAESWGIWNQWGPEPEPTCSHWERPTGGSGPQGLKLSTLSLEAEEVISGVLKVTQCGMGQYSNLSLSPSLSHTTEFDLFRKNKKMYIYFFYKETCVVVILHHDIQQKGKEA